MQAKVCPKCGSENKPDRASCSGCYTSLEAVAPIEVEEKPVLVAQPVARQPRATAPTPPTAPAVSSDGPPSPNYGPPTTYGPMSNERRPSPVKCGPNWGAIALVVVLLAGAGFAGWWFLLKPDSPEAVLRKFQAASKAGDYDAMKACLCQEQAAAMANLPGGEQAMRDGVKKAASQASTQNAEFDVLKTSYENDGSIAVLEIKPKDISQLPPGIASIEFVLIRESGSWKMDMKATGIRMMKKAFPNGMPGMPPPK